MTSGRRRICVVTAARSEYGLLYWLMREIDEDPQLELQLVVTGAHLSKAHGLTVQVVEQDGFRIDAQVDMLLESDEPVAIGRSMGRLGIDFAQVLADLAPDILVVLGDRFELLPLASVALVAGVPIAHISGGDVTEGAIDNQVRHAVTKMASLHFPGTDESARRIIQMGEDPARVFVVGEPGLDNIAHLDRIPREQLAQDLELQATARWVLLAYHPETLAPPGQDINRLRIVLETLRETPDLQIIMTWPNSDPGGLALGAEMERWANAAPAKFQLYRSLGQRRFLSMMFESACMVGNSSSAIVEAPSIPLPAVDIGNRQTGRLAAGNIIHVNEGAELASAIALALSDAFRAGLAGLVNPYGSGTTSLRIKEHLKGADLAGLRMKGFHEIDWR
jgi:UDP-hydrolysing UDP-N-acetyl-D-glucosamine 2-epimerase